MYDCKECGDIGLTLEPYATGPDFCTCDVGHDLMIRSHDYHYSQYGFHHETKEND